MLATYHKENVVPFTTIEIVHFSNKLRKVADIKTG